MDRLIRQILNMVLRRGARHMMQKASRGGQGGNPDKPKGQGGNNAQRQSAKRAQQALRAGRKIGRF